MDARNASDIEGLIRKYGTMVLRHAYFYLHDRQKSEDACQEVFLRMYKKKPVLPDEQSYRAYILRVTINVCKDMLKSAWNRRVIPLAEGYEIASDQPTPEKQAVSDETGEEIITAIMELPAIYKDVVLLYYYDELSTSEVAKVLSVPEVTVRTRLMRARGRLEEKLKGKV